jgi:transposase InsO family protein
MNSVFALCGISRQAHHQGISQLMKEKQQEGLYVRMMGQVREIHPGMGIRTMYEMLKPEGIGRDAFVALGLQEGFRLKSVEKKTRTTYSVKSSRYGNLLGGGEFTDINQVWSSDITYLYCLDRTFYIVLIMDIYSRRIVGYSVADNMRAENNVRALRMALRLRGIEKYGGSLIHHSDKGTQYACNEYTGLLESHGVRISMCDEVYENTHIERVNDTIKNQYLNRMDITSRKQLDARVDESIKAYNETRPHQSLNQMSPVQYETQLPGTEKSKRKKMTVYTIKKEDKSAHPEQLNLFDIH